MYLSQIILSREQSKALKITDTYSLHRIVYDCFEKTRENMQDSSGILFVETQGNALEKKILILSKEKPQAHFDCILNTKVISEAFFNFPLYRFNVIVNPVKRDTISRKLIPMRTREDIAHWFYARTEKWGFSIQENTLEILDISLDIFNKNQQRITIGKAKVQGVLKIINKDIFLQTFLSGLGKGKAFGCGLLQINPIYS